MAADDNNDTTTSLRILKEKAAELRREVKEYEEIKNLQKTKIEETNQELQNQQDDLRLRCVLRWVALRCVVLRWDGMGWDVMEWDTLHVPHLPLHNKTLT